MNVKQLLSALESVPGESWVRVDGDLPVALTPESLGSYRGYYQDLAIAVQAERYGKLDTVKAFRDALRGIIGETIHGYKGGDYRVYPETRVWISNYGECSGAEVTGIREDGSFVYLSWAKDDD